MKPLCKYTRLCSLLPAVLFTLFLFCAQARAMVVTEHRVVMGTKLDITLSVDNKERAGAAFTAVEEEFAQVEKEMSEWIVGSSVSLINRNAGKTPVVVSDGLFNVITAAMVVSELTSGSFDITWAAMHGLWDFRPGKERKPTAAEIKTLAPLIDFRQVELNAKKKSVFLKRPGMKIGLGGIAKGYAIDLAAARLLKIGIKNSIIRAGGDMRVQGERDDGVPWKIGIRHPRKKGVLGELSLKNISISTSGDYEHFFTKDGVLYHHIIDPRSGYPARGCMSVTILAPDTMTSDALSTAIFVLGPEKGLKLINRLNGIEAIVVGASGAVLTSEGIDLSK